MLIQFDTSWGLCVLLRRATEEKRASGFKIKRKSAMLFSERNGYSRGLCVGPLYFGLYGGDEGL